MVTVFMCDSMYHAPPRQVPDSVLGAFPAPGGMGEQPCGTAIPARLAINFIDACPPTMACYGQP